MLLCHDTTTPWHEDKRQANNDNDNENKKSVDEYDFCNRSLFYFVDSIQSTY